VQLDPRESLRGDPPVNGILDGSQRMPRLDDSPLYLSSPFIAVVADEPVDDTVEPVERWGKRHAEDDRWTV